MLKEKVKDGVLCIKKTKNKTKQKSKKTHTRRKEKKRKKKKKKKKKGEKNKTNSCIFLFHQKIVSPVLEAVGFE